MSSEYLEDGGKFWSCEVKKKSTIVRFGKVGCDGTEKETVHASLAAAKKAMEKQVNEKLKKGYKRKREDEEDDEEEDRPPPKKKAKPKPKPKAGKKGKKQEEEDMEEDEEEEKPKKAEKKKKESSPAPTGRGPRPVDRLVAGRDGFSVHEDYTCKLNQTNIGGNNNKYYIIQLLTKGGGYWTWNRWGRVGEPGQNALKKCSSLQEAINGFQKKYQDKTRNHWNNRANFVPVPGKYTLIETEEEEGGDETSDVPLGKLSKPQIEKGQAVLEEIEAQIESGGKNKNQSLNELSSRYFTLIPTDWGRRRPEPITSKDKLLEQVELLKFYLRMGFQDMDDDGEKVTPINGLAAIPLPPTLLEAAKNIAPSGEIGKCVFKGKGMEEKQAGGPTKKMCKEAYGSIFLYTGNAVYAALNKALRDENRAKVKQYFNYLRLLINSLDTLPKKPVTLWRGIGVDLFDQYKVGSTITWWSVSSCTADINVAKSFMNGCGGKKTLITVKSKTATDISMLSFYANEKESLLAPGTQLKVLKSKRVGDVAEIEMEEVGRLIE